MPLPTTYQTGSASIANGATAITFAGAILGTAIDPAIQPGDLFCDPAQPDIPPQRILSIDYDATTAVLWANWPGTSMTSDPYEVRFTGDPVRSTAQTRKLLEQLSVIQATASNLFFLFDDTTTDSDPGPGKFRINNASIASSTGGYIDDLDAKGATIGAVMQSWDDQGTAAGRGQLWIRSVTTPSTFHALKITGSVTDGSGYRKLAWTYIAGAGGFAADDEMMVFFVPQGADGTNAILGVWQGAWQTSTVYALNDLVQQGGSTYICLTAHTSGTFATDLAALKWGLAVSKGDTGATGATGATGSTGPTGPIGVTWQGAYSGATAYVLNDAVLDNASSWRALGATTGHAPPTLPTTSNTWWTLIAAKGTDGAGTGDVVGPASATSDNIATYNGTTGKIVKDSGKAHSTDGTLASNSDAKVPTEKAVKTYVDVNGFPDSSRRNALLTLASIAKLDAGYKRQLNTFADGYKASDGVSGGTVTNGSVVTGSGYAGPTVTDTRVTGGTPTTPNFGGTAANINDNSTGTSITTSALGTLSSSTVAQRIIGQIDYGSNKTITKIEVVGISLSSATDSGEAFYTSPDGTTWTQYGSNLSTINTSPQTLNKTGSVTARYIALVAAATGWGSITMSVQDLNGYQPLGANMTLVTTTQTADASVSNGRVLMEIDNSGGGTLNTDLTAEVTCDGGSHWAAATLSSIGLGQNGRTVVETADTACTAGTSFAARIKTLNSKTINVYKTTLTVH